jgi:phage tail-like protein
VRRRELLELIPDVFAQGATGDADALSALLGLVEQIHEPDERILADFGRYLDAYRAPDDFVPYLSWWVDMAWLFLDPPDDPYAEPGRPFAGGVGALRELVAGAAALAKWRGTSAGLIGLLETATGVEGFRVEEAVVDERGRAEPFRIRVLAPPEAERLLELVTRIVDHEKPAHVVASVELLAAGPA